ncbi:MAG: hypothetical protein R3B99_06895 [Polyangiales bacterium]|nr:hypothetical protein [Myxococcales bacterium]
MTEPSSRPESSAPEAPGLDVEREFRALVGEGLREYGAGNWSEARALFQRAYDLVPSAEALRMMGNASYELRQYSRSVELLERALSESARPLRPERAVEATDALERARRFVAVVTVELEPRDLHLEIDLAPVSLRSDGTLLLDPGSHRFVARADGFETRELNVELAAGQAYRFVIALVAEPSPSRESSTSEPPTSEPAASALLVDHPPLPPPPRVDLAPLLSAQGEARRARMSLRASRVGLVFSVAMVAVGGLVMGLSDRTDGLTPTFLGGDCRYQCRWSGGSVLGLTLTVAGGVGSLSSLVAWLVRRRSARRTETRTRVLELEVRRETEANSRSLELASEPLDSSSPAPTPSPATPSPATPSPATPSPSTSSTPSPATPSPATPSPSASSTPSPATSALPFGTLTLDAQPWCVVEIDGEVIGQTPIVAQRVPVGARVVTCTNTEVGARRELHLVVREGEHLRQRIQLP